jgi:hypothetical protein
MGASVRANGQRWRSGLRLAGACALALVIPACESGGHFTILGYSTRPNYDTKYKTIKVNIFKNPTFWAVVPVPGLEMQLTEALVREIEEKTPYKVVQCNADTELIGSVKFFTKGILGYNQLFEVREAETTLTVEVLWRDIKTGQILTMMGRRPGQPLPAEAIAAPPTLAPGILAPIPAIPTSPLTAPTPTTVPDTAPLAGPTPPPPGTPLGPLPPGAAVPPWAFQLVRSVAHFRPELGESISTAQKKNVDRMAVQIVSMMEAPW